MAKATMATVSISLTGSFLHVLISRLMIGDW